jgi:hypothetical protein
MTLKAPIDPCAEVAALMVERGISDRIVYSRVWLSQITSGAVPIPINDRRRLRMLAEVLRCQPFYLDKIVKEWREHIGDPLPEPKPPRRRTVWVDDAEKTIAAEKPAPAPKAKPAPVQQPDHICCDTCHVTRPIAEYHLKTSTSTCRICLAAAKDIRIAARRAERRKAAYLEKQQAKENEPIFGSWCISWE